MVRPLSRDVIAVMEKEDAVVMPRPIPRRSYFIEYVKQSVILQPRLPRSHQELPQGPLSPLFLRYDITLQAEVRLRKRNRLRNRQISRSFGSGQLQEPGVKCTVDKPFPVDIRARNPGDGSTLDIHTSGKRKHIFSVADSFKTASAALLALCYYILFRYKNKLHICRFIEQADLILAEIDKTNPPCPV